MTSKPRSINMRAAALRDWLLRDMSGRRSLPKDLSTSPDWSDLRREMADAIASELETLKHDVEAGQFPHSAAVEEAHAALKDGAK